MRFLIDAQLPPALAQHLVDLGHDAVHVGDVGLLTTRDQDIWRQAVAIGAVLVTKDEDFVTMRALSTAAGPPVIWVRVGNATRRALIQRFSAVCWRPWNVARQWCKSRIEGSRPEPA